MGPCLRRGFATDVRPENALVADADGSLTAIDFIVGRFGRNG